MNDKTQEQIDFEKRVVAFAKAVKELEQQHRVVQMPVISWTKFGASPDLDYLDYDQLEKMKKAQSQPVVESVA